MNFLDMLLQMKMDGVDSRDPNKGIMLDGNVSTTDMYLKSMTGNGNQEFYRRYLDHLRYFVPLYKFVGDKDIERLSPVIMQTAWEYGSVALTKVKGKYNVVHPFNLKYSQDFVLEEISGIAVRVGYGKIDLIKPTKLKIDNTVVLKTNFNALPFIFFWRDVIDTIITLKDSALTASVAEIKKFKRAVSNNHSSISQIETRSMMDPKTPYITNIVAPTSYLDEMARSATGGDERGVSTGALRPNEITFESKSIGSAEALWSNIQAYLEFEYFQKNRRINTNKKAERNIEKEISTETDNFDIQDGDFENWLDIFVEEFNTKFNTNIEWVRKIDEIRVSEENLIDMEVEEDDIKV